MDVEQRRLDEDMAMEEQKTKAIAVAAKLPEDVQKGIIASLNKAHEEELHLLDKHYNKRVEDMETLFRNERAVRDSVIRTKTIGELVAKMFNDRFVEGRRFIYDFKSDHFEDGADEALIAYMEIACTHIEATS